MLLTGNRVGSVERTLAAATAQTISPFTGQSQVQDFGASWWVYSISISNVFDRSARTLSGDLSGLLGPVTVFNFRDPTAARAADMPVSYGSPVVSGASQTGTSLATGGWTASTLVMEVGDFFSIGTGDSTRMHQLTQSVTSDGSGLATLNFVPPLRESPGDTDPIEIDAPEVSLRLNGPVETVAIIGGRRSFSVSAREAI